MDWIGLDWIETIGPISLTLGGNWDRHFLSFASLKTRDAQSCYTAFETRRKSILKLCDRIDGNESVEGGKGGEGWMDGWIWRGKVEVRESVCVCAGESWGSVSPQTNTQVINAIKAKKYT